MPGGHLGGRLKSRCGRNHSTIPQNVFLGKLGKDNQIDSFTPKRLLDVESFKKLGDGSDSYSYDVFEKNINIAIQYVAAWLSGNGAVALNNLMEDLATAEISIFQLKQWYNNNVQVSSYCSLNSFSEIEYNLSLIHI